MSFEEDMVGALMDFEDVQIRPDVSSAGTKGGTFKVDPWPSGIGPRGRL